MLDRSVFLGYFALMADCPSIRCLQDLLNNPARNADDIQQHLSHCPQCRAALQRMSALPDLTPSTVPTRITPHRVIRETVIGNGVPAPLPEIGTDPITSELPAQQPRSQSHRDTHPAQIAERVIGQRRIAGYDVYGEVGRGGMGIVYHAYDNRLKRHVAVKMVLAGLRADRDTLGRFRAEAELIAQVQHPNIVQVYEVDEFEGLPYLALEYVPGGTLHGRLAASPQAPAEAASLVETLARAVHHAHERGIVHRDLKPGNILLGKANTPLSQSEPKIADFGLAKLEGNSDRYTHAGDILGTPGYLAPEQAEGVPSAIGPPCDIYSLGVILYECLTGRAPFHSANHLDTLLMVRTTEPVPPSRLQPTVPRDLEVICLKCLEKDPARRYSTANDLADDLRRFQEGRSIHARPASSFDKFRKWASREPLVAVLMLVTAFTIVAGFGGITWAMLEARRSAGEAQSASAQLLEQNKALAYEQGQAEKNRLAAVAASSDAKIRLVRNLLERGLNRCQTSENASGMVLILGALGLSEGLQSDPDLTADQRAQVSVLDRLLRQNLAMWSFKSQLRLRAALPHSNWVWDVAFSPDGKTVVTADADHGVRFWDAYTAELRGHVLFDAPVVKLSFHPKGHLLLAATHHENTSQVQVIHLPTREIDPQKIPFVAQFTRLGLDTFAGFSPDGRYLYSLARSNQLRFYDPATLEEQQVIRAPENITKIAFSPDGERVAIGTLSEGVRIFDPATGQPVTGWLPQNGTVTAIAFRPDKRVLMVAVSLPVEGQPMGGETSWWDLTTEMPVGKRLRARGPIRFADYTPDGRTCVVAAIDNNSTDGFNGILYGFDGRTFTTKGGPWQMPGAPWSGAFNLDSSRLVIGCEDGGAQVFIPHSWEWLGKMEHAGSQPGTVRSIAFSPDLSTYIMGSLQDSGCAATLAVLGTRQEFVAPIKVEAPAGALAFDAEGRELWAVLRNGRTARWQVMDGQPLPGGFRLPEGMASFTMSEDASKLVAWKPVDVRPWFGGVWEMSSSRPQFNFRFPFRLAEFSNDGHRLITSGHLDKSVKIWDADQGHLNRSFQPEGEPHWAGLSGDGKRMLFTRADWNRRQPSLWNAESGADRIDLPIQSQRAARAAMHPDGESVLVLFEDHTARWWKLNRLDSARATFRPTARAVRSGEYITPKFDPKGRWAVTVIGPDAFLWDLELGLRLGPALQHRGMITAIAIHPGGELIATSGEDGTIRIWRIPPPLNEPTERLLPWVESIARMTMEEGPSEAVVPLSDDEVRERRIRLRKLSGDGLFVPTPIVEPSRLGPYEEVGMPKGK